MNPRLRDQQGQRVIAYTLHRQAGIALHAAK